MNLIDRVGSRLKLRDLHILAAVVEWKSMARAARHLAVSQPVVSRAIAELEHALGVRLLDRTPRGVEPTIYGRVLLSRGMAVFDELRASVKDIEFLSNPTTGELRIGSTPSIAAGLLPAVLDRLSRQRPRIAFHVKLGDAAVLHYRDLRERSVDLLFGRLLSAREADLDTEVLFEDRIVIAAGAHNPWTRRRKIALHELADEPWTMPPPDSYPASLVAEAFRASGLPLPHVAVAGYGIELHGALLSTGRFLAPFPESFVRLNGRRLALKALAVDLPATAHPFGIATLKGRTLGPLATLFIECARSLSNRLMA
jgi:DNA-binding transcriptional LysR family regulator